jgi:hypothetical protein
LTTVELPHSSNKAWQLKVIGSQHDVTNALRCYLFKALRIAKCIKPLPVAQPALQGAVTGLGKTVSYYPMH